MVLQATASGHILPATVPLMVAETVIWDMSAKKT